MESLMFFKESCACVKGLQVRQASGGLRLDPSFPEAGGASTLAVLRRTPPLSTGLQCPEPKDRRCLERGQEGKFRPGGQCSLSTRVKSEDGAEAQCGKGLLLTCGA